MKKLLKGKDHTAKFHVKDIKANRVNAVIACTGMLFFIPLVAAPESRFGKYWANQGLLILFVETAAAIVGFALGGLLWLAGLIPYVGVVFRILRVITAVLIWCIILLYIIYAANYAARGRARDIPIIGYMRIIT